MIPLSAASLRGSYTPIITPFRNGEIDLDTFAVLVDRQIVQGGHGVLVTGTTAEPSSLTIAERNELVRVAVATAAGRRPVVAATGSQSYADTIALTKSAEEAGADAVLVVTPYYIKPSQAGLVEYFVAVGRETRLPLLIYHIPGRAAVSVTVETVAKIADRLPTLVGMKHAVNDLELVTEVLARLGRDFRVFCGLEALSLPMLAVGAAGVMNAVGNLAPDRVAALCNAVAAGDLGKARRLHDELFQLNQAIFFDTNPVPLKYMMSRLGLLSAPEVRLPLVEASVPVRERLDEVLRNAGLLAAAAR
ncbi:MAG TPA: 4-hydroxy-tetrahydrodipicolinate synthase [Vicinamibacterales bacterium]|jgi:4-hydroxy-tetrahydrodipicolinate synthase|nr:4-hydroxy-tetrahydrodipicolinate synthase [Vicinamibacterales bacterium]